MSNIDPTKFDASTNDNNLSTEDLETQFTNAQTDIEALENTVGGITAAEATQIQQIDSVTISNAQWAYVGNLDQGVASTDSPNFGGATISATQYGYVGSMDQGLATTDAVTFATIDTGNGPLEVNTAAAKVNGTSAGEIPTNAQIGAYVPAITDSATDAYTVSAGRAIGTDETFTGDVGSANTTTTPTLDNTDGADGALTVTTKDGSALWAGALSGVHKFQKAASSWLVLDPIPQIPDSTTKTGADATLVSGTAGTSGNLAQWNVDGDAVDSGVATSDLDAVVEGVTDSDTLTWHEIDRTAVAAASYATVFDLTGAVDLIDGTIFGNVPGFRLTVDGTVVANRTSVIGGRNSAGDNFGVIAVPQASASTSIKLEAYNPTASSNDVGWRVVTR